MKQYFCLLALVVLMCLPVCGCEQGGGRLSTGSEVSPQSFPKLLAGTWKADASDWQITLAPDGEVVSAISSNGMYLPVAKGHSLQEIAGENEFIYMEFGPSNATYDTGKRELSAVVSIEHIEMESPGGSLEMYIQYHLTGPVDKGGRRWLVTWWTTGGSEGLGQTEPNDIDYETLFFNKL